MPNLLIDPSNRSFMMSRIKSEKTAPELLLMREIRRRGVWFQANYKGAPGRPDLARPRDRLAVFVDGDFWHGRELSRIEDKHGFDSPWATKLRRNIQRDEQIMSQLHELGWRILRVWESDLRRRTTRPATVNAVEEFLRSGSLSIAPSRGESHDVDATEIDAHPE